MKCHLRIIALALQFYLALITSVFCYNTMQPLWIPTNVFNAFSMTWVNAIGAATSHS